MLLVCLGLMGCSGELPEPSLPEIAEPSQSADVISPAPSPPDTPPPMPDPPEFIPPAENPGLTSANVRLFLADSESWWYPYPYRLFDLSQVEYYHEFVRCEGSLRIIFTTETTVRDFKYLDIVWNDNYFRENVGENERLYSVLDILYVLDEFTPEMPFIVTGANLGCALASDGFSFVDEYGETRYFYFLMSGADGEGFIVAEY
jgi:hypothetical protein